LPRNYEFAKHRVYLRERWQTLCNSGFEVLLDELTSTSVKSPVGISPPTTLPKRFHPA
jgi:hypothetical protein